MVCGGQTNRLEVASELLKNLNLEQSVKISQVSSDYFKSEYFAERPPCERLVNKKLELRKINLMRDWRITLKEYLNNYYKGYLS